MGRAASAAAQPVGFLPGWLQTPNAHRWALRGVVALLIVAVGACFAVGAGRPRSPGLLPAAAGAGLTGHSSPVSKVAGFGQIGFRVVTPQSAALGGVRCALLADTPAARAIGMTGRRDLGGYDAMIFRFPAASADGFYDKGVPIALSIAWFDSAGALVGTARLATCTTPCPSSRPPVPYRLALEVPAGGLHRLGVGPGSALVVGGSCGG